MTEVGVGHGPPVTAALVAGRLSVQCQETAVVTLGAICCMLTAVRDTG
jgi:hypothetical protein